MYPDTAGLEESQLRYMNRLWQVTKDVWQLKLCAYPGLIGWFFLLVSVAFVKNCSRASVFLGVVVRRLVPFCTPLLANSFYVDPPWNLLSRRPFSEMSTCFSNAGPLCFQGHAHVKPETVFYQCICFVMVSTQDTLGFAGLKMIRRVLGVSHVEDLEGISDRTTKVKCERHALALGRRLAMVRETSNGDLSTPEDVLVLARSLANESDPVKA